MCYEVPIHITILFRFHIVFVLLPSDIMFNKFFLKKTLTCSGWALSSSDIIQGLVSCVGVLRLNKPIKFFLVLLKCNGSNLIGWIWIVAIHHEWDPMRNWICAFETKKVLFETRSSTSTNETAVVFFNH